MPREDLRKIGARDRHAAHKIAEIRQRHPNAVIMVLFGESHLAPGHLPRVLRESLASERVLTVLQNVDALYWHAAGEKQEHVQAVRVTDDVVCAFNSTPLEKYENYRLHLSRWGRTDEEGPDLTPTIYNLIDGLLRFLDINRYSSHNGTQPKFLIDLLPEVYCRASDARLRRLLSRYRASDEETAALAHYVEERGSVYLPQVNAFYVREFQMLYAAEEIARFLHHACRGLPMRGNGHMKQEASDRFYVRTVEHLLGYFGSRVLYPARPTAPDAGAISRAACEAMAEAALRADTDEFESSSQRLGYALGSELYDSYLQGQVTRAILRHLFLAHLDEPGRAKEICLGLIRRLRCGRKKSRPSCASS
jgi:hypothetical protein